MTDLSVIIPSRNEMFLRKTIEDILANMRGDTEIIAVLDGQWAEPQIVDHPKVVLVHHSVSIGQRAATNEAVRMSMARYVMKVDAHCAFDEGFDVKLMADMHRDWTVAPTMRNLHAFDWVCPDGHRRYQGPSGPCKECGKPTTMDVVWIAKTNPQSNSYCFDPEPHFRYFGEYNKRQEGRGNLTESMSLQGSCFMMTRRKYKELDVCDESLGSWGSQGIEVACKTWLSGGKVMINHNTWYAHLFRTQGADFGFPYELSGHQVEHAKKMAKNMFFNGHFPKQTRPLSWLVERFWPVPGWSEDDLVRVRKAGASFTSLGNKLVGVSGVVPSVPGAVANHTTPVTVDSGGQDMTILAGGLPSFPGGSSIPLENVNGVRNELQMNGITAEAIVTDVVKNRDITSLTVGDRANEPGIHEPMNAISDLIDADVSVTRTGGTSNPNPTSGVVVDPDLSKDAVNGLRGNIVDNEHLVHTHIVSLSGKNHNVLTKGIVYYTDNRLDPLIMGAVQRQIKNSVNSHAIISVSLQPLRFGENTVLDLKRGPLTLHKQILAGLEACKADIIFLCEHDILYHKSHFDFVPPDKDKFYYNTNVWRVRYPDGHAVWTDNLQQTSGVCAYRELLLDFYRKRVEAIEKSGFDGHYEPNPRANWQSEFPNLDIRHSKTMTKSKWSPEEFRDPKYAQGWKEASEIPGWGRVEGNLKSLMEVILA